MAKEGKKFLVFLSILTVTFYIGDSSSKLNWGKPNSNHLAKNFQLISSEKEQKTISESFINLKPLDNDFKLKVISEKLEIVSGHVASIFIRPNKDCYLTVFEIDKNNKVKMLFPNKLNKNNFLEERKSRLFGGLPLKTLGVKKLKFIATLSKESPFNHLHGKLEENYQTYSSEEVKQIVDQLSLDPSLIWAESILELYIYEETSKGIAGSPNTIPITESPTPTEILGTWGLEMIRPEEN